MAGPRFPDINTLIAAGFDPKTGLPRRMSSDHGMLKADIKKVLRITDEQNAINRYTWYNLPDITSQELERLLYYRGQLCIFYNKELNKFFYLPYALDGEIDVYGRYQSIHPVPVGSTSTETEKKRTAQLGDWLSQLHLNCKYDIILPEEWKPEMMTSCTALLHDYSKQLSQTIIPRQQVNDVLLDVEANCIPFMNTALLNGTGVRGVRVNNEDEAFQVFEAAKSTQDAALTGHPYLPMIGDGLDFQDFTDGTLAKAEEFLLAMQSLDNIRLGTYGIENGGIFNKQERKLVSEQDMIAGEVGAVLQDGLTIRQTWCNIVNSIWGLGIWCEVSEWASGADKNMDGEVSDEQDGQLPMDNGGMEQ